MAFVDGLTHIWCQYICNYYWDKVSTGIYTMSKVLFSPKWKSVILTKIEEFDSH